MTQTEALTAIASFASLAGVHPQEFSTGPVFITGLVNYRGGLKPYSFTFQHSNCYWTHRSQTQLQFKLYTWFYGDKVADLRPSMLDYPPKDLSRRWNGSLSIDGVQQ